MNHSSELNITPTEFEQFVFELMKAMGKDLINFEVAHNTVEVAHDGSYQIDIKATFEVFNTTFITLIECKRHTNSIKREVVQILHDKIRSLGAHKGMIFSTSEFQSGAEDYARSHGIALIHVIDGKSTYVTKGHGGIPKQVPTWLNLPKFSGEFSPKKSRWCLVEPGHIECLEEYLFGKLNEIE